MTGQESFFVLFARGNGIEEGMLFSFALNRKEYNDSKEEGKDARAFSHLLNSKITSISRSGGLPIAIARKSISVRAGGFLMMSRFKRERAWLGWLRCFGQPSLLSLAALRLSDLLAGQVARWACPPSPHMSSTCRHAC